MKWSSGHEPTWLRQLALPQLWAQCRQPMPIGSCDLCLPGCPDCDSSGAWSEGAPGALLHLLAAEWYFLSHRPSLRLPPWWKLLVLSPAILQSRFRLHGMKVIWHFEWRCIMETGPRKCIARINRTLLKHTLVSRRPAKSIFLICQNEEHTHFLLGLLGWQAYARQYFKHLSSSKPSSELEMRNGNARQQNLMKRC